MSLAEEFVVEFLDGGEYTEKQLSFCLGKKLDGNSVKPLLRVCSQLCCRCFAVNSLFLFFISIYCAKQQDPIFVKRNGI